ncbi:MAG TPA: response regulator [Salinivirga sp.]|uniref:response regulator transcription factor n=1 Tax=Salinivirga sp. TaxID=1970192 RepID=UPI002B465383|nr:response regulator [Salinivirga sp.]HKK58965.1 response regulator [Salinivirga sp.]
MYKILIADDNHHFTKALSYLLKELYKEKIQFIRSVSNGEKAVEITKNENFDIIFMDADMPVMNGIEATRKIVDKNRFVIVVAVSFHQEMEYIQEMLEAGARTYIIKEDMDGKSIENCFKLIV